MNRGQGFVEYALIAALVAIIVIIIAALLMTDTKDMRWECDTSDHTGWEREYQYSHTTYYYNAGTKTMMPQQHYEWVRIRELSEKEYAMHCLNQGTTSRKHSANA